MLATYLDQAMELASYEIIPEDGIYWGEIPPLQGVWASGKTLEACRRELREALSDWVALRLKLGLFIPEIAEINLNKLMEEFSTIAITEFDTYNRFQTRVMQGNPEKGLEILAKLDQILESKSAS